MTEPNYKIADGHIAIILQSLRNHTAIDEHRLFELIAKQFESDDFYKRTLSFVETKQWLTRSGDTLRISSSGESWLDQQGGTLTVEEDDSSSTDIPKHPYDVAKLKMEPKHLSVFQALRKIEKREIDLKPEFQRAFVWDQIKKSRLIESILIRIPLPAFYLDATDQVHWIVVDGLQRLTTLYHYCREQNFALTNLQFLLELNGKKFDELPSQYKVLIEDDTQLLFYNLMPGTPIEAKFTIFSRVNTGGMQLTPQEIRHALNQGKSVKLLSKLANSNEFIASTQGMVETLRMSDRELVLRALAFMCQPYESYKQFSELDAFLLHTMTILNSASDEKLLKLENDFLNSVVKVEKIFGRYAFRKFSERNGRRSPLNKSLFEVWTVCVRDYDLDLLIKNRDKIIDEFIQLVLNDNRFQRAVSASTGSYTAVSTRFSTIEKLLKEACK